MKLFDSHCHLDDKDYDPDLEAVIDRAREAGVNACMVVGTTTARSRKAARIAAEHDGIFASVGLHPHDAASGSDEVIDILRDLARSNPKVRAWGETGLDFNRMYSPQNDQEKWFARQIAEAAACDLSLIFHERDSRGRFLEILKSDLAPGQTGVVHCFSGNKKELTAYLDLGLYIGITGVITVKSRGEDLRQLVRHIPDDRLLVETDAPYLTPTPERNRYKRNEPAFVKTVFLKLADVRQQDPEVLAPIIWDNTCRLFKI
ncbi:MAG: TatD family hydrolase [Thermodesulfobacteriota bacterium]